MNRAARDRTLLIIDDNPIDREAICRLVAQQHAVLEVATAADGLAVVEKTQLDCILLDHRLPDREGIDLVGELAQRHIAVVS